MAAASRSVPSWNLTPSRILNVYVRPSADSSQLSARPGSSSPVVPGLSVTRPSMTFCITYDVLLSSIRAGSVRLMSPGMATTRVPPSLGAPAAGSDGELDAPGSALAGASDAGALVAVDPPQAATMIAPAASRVPIRSRAIEPPPQPECGAQRSPDGRPGCRWSVGLPVHDTHPTAACRMRFASPSP